MDMKLEDIERDRVRLAQKLEKTRAALIELRDLVQEKDRKIFYYRVKTLFLSITACFFLASTLYLVVYPDSAKAVRACLSNTTSIFRTVSTDGSPSGSSIQDAGALKAEIPAKDDTTNGSGTAPSGPAGRSFWSGSKGSPVQDGGLRE